MITEEKTYSQELNEAQAALTRAMDLAQNNMELGTSEYLRDKVLAELDRHNADYRYNDIFGK